MTSAEKRRGWLLIAAVFVVIAGASVAGFAVTRHTAQHESDRILHEKATEIGSILSTAGQLSASLQILGEVYANGSAEHPGFSAAAKSLVTGAVTAVGVVKLADGQAVVEEVEGTGPAVGDVLTGPRADVAQRAVAAKGLVSALIPGDPMSTLVVGFGRADGLVVFEDSVFATKPAPASADSPFKELDAVLYRSDTADPADLLIATTDRLPLRGTVDRQTLSFGSEKWLLLTGARQPLASPQARAVPWIILGVGVGGALLASGIVWLLIRRRAYALTLVDQRTADLRETMVELEGARGAADAANKAKSQFLSRMSHELRTPLHAVLGFAQLLELGERSGDDKDAIEHIIRGGNHLLNLINEVLDISRIESGDLALSTESVLATEVVAETFDLMRPLAAARSIHFVADRHSSCNHYVFADRQRLKQILLNLVSNAVKYNRVGGSVGVTCEEVSTTRLRLKVTDTGAGISDENMALLFVPFERLGAGLTDVEGTGIGLALSRRLAEAMGGALGVESTIGAGSTFWVELPLVEGAVERYERLSSGAPATTRVPDDERKRILYIEDNLANVTLVQRILDQRGDIELVPAMQGRLGLDLARQHHPDLILLDLHLPDISGDEVLHLLREDPETSAIPVVVVSADATVGHVQRLQAAGASAYLTKPFNARELLQTLAETLRPADALKG